MSQPINNINDLGVVVLAYLFNKLPITELPQLSTICKIWHDTLSNEDLWEVTDPTGILSKRRFTTYCLKSEYFLLAKADLVNYFADWKQEIKKTNFYLLSNLDFLKRLSQLHLRQNAYAYILKKMKNTSNNRLDDKRFVINLLTLDRIGAQVLQVTSDNIKKDINFNLIHLVFHGQDSYRTFNHEMIDSEEFKDWYSLIEFLPEEGSKKFKNELVNAILKGDSYEIVKEKMIQYRFQAEYYLCASVQSASSFSKWKTQIESINFHHLSDFDFLKQISQLNCRDQAYICILDKLKSMPANYLDDKKFIIKLLELPNIGIRILNFSSDEICNDPKMHLLCCINHGSQSYKKCYKSRFNATDLITNSQEFKDWFVKLDFLNLEQKAQFKSTLIEKISI